MDDKDYFRKREIYRIYLLACFSALTLNMCAGCEKTLTQKKDQKKRKKIRRKMKRSSSPSLSSPKPQKFFWEDCISLCFINLIVQQLVRQCSQTPFMSVLAQGGRGIALLRQLSCTRNQNFVSPPVLGHCPSALPLCLLFLALLFLGGCCHLGMACRLLGGTKSEAWQETTHKEEKKEKS